MERKRQAEMEVRDLSPEFTLRGTDVCAAALVAILCAKVPVRPCVGYGWGYQARGPHR